MLRTLNHRQSVSIPLWAFLFSKRSQMTSKCGINKMWHSRRYPSVSLMFLPRFDALCDPLLNRRTATWNLFVLNNKERNNCRFSISKSFIITWKPTFAHFGEHAGKQPFDIICCLIQDEAISLVTMRSKELWLVQENQATVKLDSNGFSSNQQLTTTGELNCEIQKS